jgi:hypothetical protein
MTPLTDSEIEEMERLEREASRAGWTAGTWADYGSGTILGTSGYPLARFIRGDALDVALVVALRNAAPRLSHAARDANRLREQVATLREALEHAERELAHSDSCNGEGESCTCGTSAAWDHIAKALASTEPTAGKGGG